MIPSLNVKKGEFIKIVNMDIIPPNIVGRYKYSYTQFFLFFLKKSIAS